MAESEHTAMHISPAFSDEITEYQTSASTHKEALSSLDIALPLVGKLIKCAIKQLFTTSSDCCSQVPVVNWASRF